MIVTIVTIVTKTMEVVHQGERPVSEKPTTDERELPFRTRADGAIDFTTDFDRAVSSKSVPSEVRDAAIWVHDTLHLAKLSAAERLSDGAEPSTDLVLAVFDRIAARIAAERAARPTDE